MEDDYCEYEDGELEEIAEEPEDESPSTRGFIMYIWLRSSIRFEGKF